MLVVQQRWRQFDCSFGDEILEDMYPRCVGKEERREPLPGTDGTPLIWHLYNDKAKGYLLPVDLGVWRVPKDTGLCSLRLAQATSWATRATKELRVHFVVFNGPLLIWATAQVTFTFLLGGDVDTTTFVRTLPGGSW